MGEEGEHCDELENVSERGNVGEFHYNLGEISVERSSKCLGFDQRGKFPEFLKADVNEIPTVCPKLKKRTT